MDNQDKKLFNFAYYMAGYAAVEVVRALCQIGSISFWEGALSYFAFDLLNIAFGLLVFMIACHQQNLVVDMHAYLNYASKTPSSAMAREQIDDYQSLESLAEQYETSDISLLDGGYLSPDEMTAMSATYRKHMKPNTKFTAEQNAIKEMYKKKGSRV